MYTRVIKIAFGATLAIAIAQGLELRFALAAGIITILSVQETKRKSIDVVLRRLLSMILAFTISTIIFKTVGFNMIAFGLYLLLFLPISFRFGLGDGIAVNSVLVTHFLSEEFVGFSMWLNGMGLMGIGAGMALLFNMYMPNMLPKIKSDQISIEADIRRILTNLAAKLRYQACMVEEKELFEHLENFLGEAQVRAFHNQGNYLLVEMTYYTKYMNMRSLQFEVLKTLWQLADKVETPVGQRGHLAELTESFATQLHELNTGDLLIQQTTDLLETFRKHPLPTSREEFENRALLFQYINEFRHLLEIKQNFLKDLTESEQVIFEKSKKAWRDNT